METIDNETKNEVIPASNQAVAVSEQEGFLAMMERLAMGNVDVVKIEKMMDLHQRMLDRNAKAEFAADYVKMKPELPKVLRTKKNTQTDSKYAPLEDINEAVDPILMKYGFGTSTKIISQTPDSVTVKAELWHRGGHIEETVITMPLDNVGIKGTVNKTGPHATAASVTYAKRVAICALLNISTGDDKDGNEDGAVLDNEKAVEIDQRINKMPDAQQYKPKFLAYMKAESILAILAKDYAKAMNAIKTKEDASTKGNKP